MCGRFHSLVVFLHRISVFCKSRAAAESNKNVFLLSCVVFLHFLCDSSMLFSVSSLDNDGDECACSQEKITYKYTRRVSERGRIYSSLLFVSYISSSHTCDAVTTGANAQ